MCDKVVLGTAGSNGSYGGGGLIGGLRGATCTSGAGRSTGGSRGAICCCGRDGLVTIPPQIEH